MLQQRATALLRVRDATWKSDMKCARLVACTVSESGRHSGNGPCRMCSGGRPSGLIHTHMRPPPAQCSTLQLQHSAHLGVCVPVPLDLLQQRMVQTEWVTRRQQPSQLPPSLRNATMCARQSRITGDFFAVTLLRHRNITYLFADGL